VDDIDEIRERKRMRVKKERKFNVKGVKVRLS
jgi:hypothetical protein